MIDLGHQPLCDTLPDAAQLRGPEITYPLRQVRCPACTLSQLDYVVDAAEVFHPEYPYRTGITRELAEYQGVMAKELIARLALRPDSLVVDIGSNDGTLLRHFGAESMHVLGIEPTNVAQVASAAGIETIQAFFDVAVARRVVESHGRASLVTATNVFAHVAALGEFVAGVEALLAPDGTFVLENHYLPAILRGNQYDTIYHEHLRSYSLRSLVVLFDQYDFTVVRAEEVSRYGGNIRVFVAKGRNKQVDASVGRILRQEEDLGLARPDVYRTFRTNADASKRALLELALSARANGESFVGNSCPGRAVTLLNFCGIGPDLMSYIAEQPASRKLDRFLPGTHIPIVSNEILVKEQPDWIVLLAWHYWEPISRQLRERGVRSKLVVPLPTVRVLER